MTVVPENWVTLRSDISRVYLITAKSFPTENFQVEIYGWTMDDLLDLRTSSKLLWEYRNIGSSIDFRVYYLWRMNLSLENQRRY